MQNIQPPSKLEQDEMFQLILKHMCEDYGITKDAVYNIIYGETVPKWNWASFNNGSQASGAFQFIPATVQWLNKIYDTDINTFEVRKMEPAEQLTLYDRYLKAWKYDGGVALGFMQAAPGKYYNLRKEGKKITDDLVVYPKGTRAWYANPGWRDRGGDITIGSINRYYDKVRWKE